MILSKDLVSQRLGIRLDCIILKFRYKYQSVSDHDPKERHHMQNFNNQIKFSADFYEQDIFILNEKTGLRSAQERQRQKRPTIDNQFINAYLIHVFLHT